MISIKSNVLIAGFTLLAVGAVQAAPVVFIGLDDPREARANSIAARADFIATLSSSGTDDIEAGIPFTEDPMLVFGDTGVTAKTDVDLVFSSTLGPTSGSNFLIARNDGDNEFFLSAPVTAFAFNLIAAGYRAAPTTIGLRLRNTTAGTSKDVAYTFNDLTHPSNVLFLGVTDLDGFDRVSYFSPPDPYQATGFDDVTVGFVAVPEPASMALLAVGGLALLRRRRVGT